jgi:hypothetical protein
MHLGHPRFYESLSPKRESFQRTFCAVLRRHVGNILSKDGGKATRMVHRDKQHIKRMEVRIANAASRCFSMWQKNQGPGLPVKNRIVTLSPASPMRTTPGVTEDWVLRVVRGVPSTVYNNERTFMQMNGMLFGKGSSKLVRLCRQMPA